MARQVIQPRGPGILEQEGLAPEPEPWEDGIRADTGRGILEWWYFDSHFEDGSTAVFTFMTKPLANRTDPLNPTLRLVITTPDGKDLLEDPFYPPSEFSASRERCDVHIGPNWARGDLHRYEVHAETGSLHADLVFTGIVPPWRNGTGIEYYNEKRTEYFGWFPSVPLARVEGTLTYEGQTHHVVGTGYHDHNWISADMSKVFSHWFWGRVNIGDYTSIFAQLVTSKAYGRQRLSAFMVAKGSEILTKDLTPLVLSVDDFEKHSGGKTYPNRLAFHWEGDEGKAHLSLRNPRIIEATSLLDYVPAWKRTLARVASINPYYFRFRAELEMRLDLAGEHTTQRGPAIYELMLLR